MSPRVREGHLSSDPAVALPLSILLGLGREGGREGAIGRREGEREGGREGGRAYLHAGAEFAEGEDALVGGRISWLPGV